VSSKRVPGIERRSPQDPAAWHREPPFCQRAGEALDQRVAPSGKQSAPLTPENPSASSPVNRLGDDAREAQHHEQHKAEPGKIRNPTGSSSFGSTENRS
jgi:hypothetical protein